MNRNKRKEVLKKLAQAVEVIEPKRPAQITPLIEQIINEVCDEILDQIESNSNMLS